MYDPHYHYYTLYGRIKGQGGISIVYILTTVIIHCIGVGMY